MNSKVTELYDYTKAPIPDELRRWRVTDEEVQEALKKLSFAHAREKEIQISREKDCVVCRGEGNTPPWNRSVLLFYPGFNLCDTAVEQAMIGKKAGDQVRFSTSRGEAVLTVIRVLGGWEPFPISDALVKMEKIDGVDTVEKYRNWYRETTQTTRREEQSIPIGVELLQQVLKKSQVYIDPKEEARWTWDWVDFQLAAYEKRGMDWKMFEGIDDSVVPEEARKRVFDNYRSAFHDCLIFRGLMEQKGIDPEEVFREGIKEYGADQEKTPEEYIRESSRSALEFSFWLKESKKIMLDYARQHLDELLEA